MTVATVISRLLDPMWVVPLVTILGAYRMGIHNFALWRMIVIIASVMVGVPLVLRWKYRTASGWDIRQRLHRPKAIGVLLGLGIVHIVLAWTLGNPMFGKLFIFYELWLVGFFLVSLFWKISGHTGGIALAAGLVIRWFGWAWWPVLFLIPLMGWARVKTRDHSVEQIVGGALYSFILLLIYETWQGVF